MSGPPGRSSSGEPVPDWPAEDLDSRSGDERDAWSANGRDADPWSAGDDSLGDPDTTPDAWQGSRDEFSLGWDDWPPVTPPTDYALGFDEPLRPSSDPWAESWVEEPPEPTDYRAEPERPRERQEPMQSQAAWPPAEPAPAPWEAREEPEEQAGWSAAPAIEAGRVDEAAVEPTLVEGPPLEPAPEEGGRSQQWSSPWRADTAPDWVVEPVEAASEPLPFLPEDEPQLVTEPEPEPAAEPEPEPPFARTPDRESQPSVFERRPEPARFEPIDVAAGIEPAYVSEEGPEPEAFQFEPVEPEAEEIAFEPLQPEPSAFEPLAPERMDLERPREYAPEPEPQRWEPTEPFEPRPEEAAARIEVPEPIPSEIVPGAFTWEPAEPPAAEPETEPEPAPPDERLWADTAPEPTRVYPSTWTPPAPSREEGLEPVAGSVRTSLAAEPEEAVAIRPTVAEHAVPWLIGVILLLAGMVIVLMALIFAGDASLGGAAASASADLGAGLESAQPSAPQRTLRPTRSAGASPSPIVTPMPVPEYGPLEVIYQGRSQALAPIYLLHRDFTERDPAVVLAQDSSLDVRRVAWAPDGTVGAALIAEILVAVGLEEEPRELAEDIAGAAFGTDADTVYAVRITEDGAEDTATVLAIGYESGEATELASVSYAQPQIVPEAQLPEAKFADEGGTVRMYWMEDGNLRLWILGGGSWNIDPESGELEEASTELPVLWSPEGNRRIAATESGTTTTLELVDEDGEVLATETVDMLVSHLRWSPSGRRVIFTGGRSLGGGVVQDLYLWDPEEETEIEQLTVTGAAFGVEWLGSLPVWRDAE